VLAHIDLIKLRLRSIPVKILSNNRILRVILILRSLFRGLVCAALFAAVSQVFAGTIGYSVRSDVDRRLYRLDMTTGIATDIGATGFSKIEALAINPAGEIYGVNPATAQLVKCSSTTGACTAVGVLTGVAQVQTNAGLAFATTGVLYLAMNAVIYRVDPATAAVAPLGGTGPALSGLAGVAPSAACASGLYGIGGNTDRGKLYCINVTNGVATLLGTISVSPLDSGLDGDPVTGLVWGVSNDVPGQVFAINPATLAVTNVNTVTLAGSPIGGFESLAVVHTADLTEPIATPTLSQMALLILVLLVVTTAAVTGVRTQRRVTLQVLRSRRK
jgi:hypothetical protein